MTNVADALRQEARLARMTLPVLAFLAGLAGPAAAQLTPEQIRTAPDSQVKYSAMFQFGRTRYFSALVAARGCDRDFAKRITKDQRAFHEVSARLQKIFGSGFDPDQPIDPASITPAPCAEVSIGSFEMKIDELRAWADRAEHITDPGAR